MVVVLIREKVAGDVGPVVGSSKFGSGKGHVLYWASGGNTRREAGKDDSTWLPTSTRMRGLG